MKFQNILESDVQAFIELHKDESLENTAFKKLPFSALSMGEILDQIESKKRCISKLPTWYSTKNIVYPKKISIEQSTSEIIAKFKASLFDGDISIDMSGGFGVDSFYLCKRFNRHVHCEINPELSAIAKHNFGVLDANNIDCHIGDSVELLKSSPRKYDLIYLDPARRKLDKKVFRFEDSSPNPVEILDLLKDRSSKIAVKASPMIDIKHSLLSLGSNAVVYIISHKNEVKELLFILSPNQNQKIICVDIENENQNQISEFEVEDSVNVAYSSVKSFLYQPSASILKAGAFRQVAAKYSIDKISVNTHLYTSDLYIPEFQGKVFSVEKYFLYGDKNLKKYLAGRKINISTRNFVDSVDLIKKKFKTKDGGDEFAIFFRDNSDVNTCVLAKIR